MASFTRVEAEAMRAEVLSATGFFLFIFSIVKWLVQGRLHGLLPQQAALQLLLVWCGEK